MFGKIRFRGERGGGGVQQNDHEFRFVGNI